jgi:subtilase family serine protease
LYITTIALTLTLGFPCAAQEEGGRWEGRVFIPDTSIERPEHVGVKAHTNHRILAEPAGGLGPMGGMVPAQLRGFYGFPTPVSTVPYATTGVVDPGSGVIAIVDAYDYPTALADFNVFSKYFGLPYETSSNATASANKVFQVVYAPGSRPKGNGGWNQEAALDIQWAHAMAPAAKIVLVEAKSASWNDLFQAVDVAKGIAGAHQVSMSWGGNEWSGESSYDTHLSAAAGPVFFAAAGDSAGKVIYPSCSRYVVAAGGTSVSTGSQGNFIAESAWSDGGGGNSTFVAKPAWQTGVSMSGGHRGVPDLSSDADPNTGVSVYDSTPYAGMKGWMVFGGTSVSTPCLAGMTNASGATFTSTTDFLTRLYLLYLGGTGAFRDITTGSNGFPALVGWDYCTGVGVPDGTGSF